jgi:hypothetical protein
LTKTLAAVLGDGAVFDDGRTVGLDVTFATGSDVTFAVGLEGVVDCIFFMDGATVIFATGREVGLVVGVTFLTAVGLKVGDPGKTFAFPGVGNA